MSTTILGLLDMLKRSNAAYISFQIQDAVIIVAEKQTANEMLKAVQEAQE